MWRLTLESGSIMQASGPRSPGDFGCVGSRPPFGLDAKKIQGAPDLPGAPLLYLAERFDYSIFRSAPIFVAEVTGGAILICGPCTVGSWFAPWPVVMRALSVFIRFCWTWLSPNAAALSSAFSPLALVWPGSLAVGCPLTGLPLFFIG